MPQYKDWDKICGGGHVAVNSENPTEIPRGRTGSQWIVCDGEEFEQTDREAWEGGGCHTILLVNLADAEDVLPSYYLGMPYWLAATYDYLAIPEI